MRSREKILTSLEKSYRDAFGAAESAGEMERMAELDLNFQRDQLFLEAVLDVRDLMLPTAPEEPTATSLIEKAQALRRLTKLGRP